MIDSIGIAIAWIWISAILASYTLLFVGIAAVIGVCITHIITTGRRRALQNHLRSRGWPKIHISVNFLFVPRPHWQRVPTYDEVMLTPTLARSAPRSTLIHTLRVIAAHSRGEV